MAAPFLVERGVEPAADEVGPALVMRLLLEMPASVPRYFRRLAEQPRMAEALWATIHEVRMAGAAAADLAPAAFVGADKHARAWPARAAMRGPHRDRAHLERLARWLTFGNAELCRVLPEALQTVEPVMASEIWQQAV